MSSMHEIAIRVDDLGKRFRIGRPNARRTLQEGLLHAAAAPLRWLRGAADPDAGDSRGEFWALRGVSFQVQRGEAIGIVGANGAGKSTLLKILSRITEPSTGRAELTGRVSSLLDVGTGFHPELTGRENIFLNGAILGMKRAEIRSRFDDIVDFSGVEKFIDTPVKRYSSGMRVRLAFAVAAHLEPEILIVDEVLAVGDARFQEKCLGQMKEVTGKGRTVLFVSHNMAAVEGLCSRAILLSSGEVAAEGNAGEVVRRYLSEVAESTGSSYRCDGAIQARAWIHEASLRDGQGREAGSFSMSEPIGIRMLLHVAEKSQYTMSVQLKELDGNPICHFPSDDVPYEIPGKPGLHEIDVVIPPLYLYPGKYLVRLVLTDTVEHSQRELQRLAFTILADGKLCRRALRRQAGLIFAHARWSAREQGAVAETCSE